MIVDEWESFLIGEVEGNGICEISLQKMVSSVET
jgi:hypothetical protein